MTKLIKKVRKAISARKKYLTTVHELSRLSNRELNDIGIHRCDIEFVARKHSKKEAA